MIDIFVISPYSDPDQDVVNEHVWGAEEYLATLIKQGHVAFSVIVAFSDFCEKYQIDSNYDYWEKYCQQMIESTHVVHVLMLDGWEDSVGVQAEIAHARSLGKLIEFIQV